MGEVFLAKEIDGSVIEVTRHPAGWITLDGRCVYERGSFEWVVSRDSVMDAANKVLDA